MAKKIRFPLQMENGASVRTLEELQENFDLKSVLVYYDNGKLETWLRDRYYYDEADQISSLKKDSVSFTSDICRILGVEFEDESSVDIEYLKRRKEKINELRSVIDDEQVIYHVDDIAMDQDELFDLLDEGRKKIYLFKNEFEIPLSAKNVTYVGLLNPIVIIRATDNVNFKEKNIKFEDIYFGWDLSHLTPDDKTLRAEKLLSIGKIQDAYDLLQTLGEQDNPRALLLLGVAAERLGIRNSNYFYDRGREIGYVLNAVESVKDFEREKYTALLRKNAAKENPIDMGYYGTTIFYTGSKEESAALFEKAASAGDVCSQYNLAYCYEEGIGVEQNLEVAIKWYLKAAENGNRYAQNKMGSLYENGIGVEQNETESFKWYRKAAEHGDSVSQNQIGYWYQAGIGIGKDEKEATKWYRKSAEGGNATAMSNLAYCYDKGIGVEKDEFKASEWYLKSAENGDIDSQNQIGYRYDEGIGVEKNSEEAVKWFKKAAEAGQIYAMYNLACSYENGDGIPKDSRKAFEWYLKAAEKGHINAQNMVGVKYQNGNGVEKNDREAFKWIKKAAENGQVIAMSNLGWLYAHGVGIGKDACSAFKWYLKAAENGDVDAMCETARRYYEGSGVSEDWNKALEWYKKAASNGSQDAKEAINSIHSSLELRRMAQDLGNDLRNIIK